MYTIDKLTTTGHQVIVDCLLDAFSNYFVAMPKDLAFWEARFRIAGLNKDLSWGVFHDKQLVAFVLHATRAHQTIAFNMATGVRPSHRGKQLVDQLYDYGLPYLRKSGFTHCALEVIDQNATAISAYERIGFKKQHQLFCFRGHLNDSSASDVRLEKIPVATYFESDPSPYSWENNQEAIAAAGETYTCYRIRSAQQAIGRVILQPHTGYIAQLESEENWPDVFSAIGQLKMPVKLNNVHASRSDLLSYLFDSPLENHINQYYMEMVIF